MKSRPLTIRLSDPDLAAKSACGPNSYWRWLKAQRLKRQSLGLSVPEVARVLHIRAARLYAWERCEGRMPDAIRTRLEELLTDSGD